jgi:hypothetical protein
MSQLPGLKISIQASIAPPQLCPTPISNRWCLSTNTARIISLA